jgi:hypothetical protein
VILIVLRDFEIILSAKPGRYFILWFFSADESTMQSVMQAYAHMCLKNNVQPLPKVLESIKVRLSNGTAAIR